MPAKEVQIVCVAVGNYPTDYVTKLYSMLRRHMPVPFRLACIVDKPREIPAAIHQIDASGWPPPRPGMRPTTYKLFLYDRDRVPFEEFIYLDTSIVIRADMGPLLDFASSRPEDLVTAKDWYYDAFNTSVMRVRQTDTLAQIPRAYEAGMEFEQIIPGDQDFVTNFLRSQGKDSSVTTFPDEMVQSFGIARRAEKIRRRSGYKLIEQAVVVKFCGQLKMDDHISRRYRLRQILETKNPFHRRAWFWVKEIKDLWR